MNEIEEMRATRREAEALQTALAANDQAVRQFLGSAALVQSAYTQALGRVNTELRALERSFQTVAAVGLNAFAGMLNAIQPAVEGFAGLVTKLFGVTVWKSNSKAMEGTASALSKVAKSTRSVAQAQKDLYSFDRITRVSAKGSSSGSSGSGSSRGGSSGEAAAGTLVRIPGLLDDLAKRAKEVLSQIWQPFQAAWEKQGEKTVQAARDALIAVGRAAGAVGESWLKAWTGGAGERAVSTVLQISQQLSETVKNIADRFREAWTAGGAGDRIMGGIFNICQSVLNTILNMATATANWTRQLDFSGLVQGFVNVINALQPLVNLLLGGMSWAYQNVLLPLAGWVIQSAAPAMLNLLSGALELLTAVLNALKPVGEFIWEKLLKPMGQWTGKVLIGGLDGAAAAFRGLANVINGLPSGWETVKQKAGTIWTGVKNAMLGAANDSYNGVVTSFVKLNDKAKVSGDSLKKKSDTLFQSISKSANNHLSGVSGAISKPFKNGFNAVIELMNKMIRRINGSLKFSWKAIKVGGKTVVSAGSAVLAKLPTVSKLAEGGITTGPTFSLIGEAGREAVLPLERNTGWMDQLAERIARGLNRSGDTVVEIHIGGEQLTRQVVRGVNDLTRRTGRCPIYV